MSKSIMQEEKECYLTGATQGLHKHHIMRGSRRKQAETWGCWVWLRADWHTGTLYSVHEDKRLERQLQIECQQRFERLYGHEKWMRVFGKNYMED